VSTHLSIPNLPHIFAPLTKLPTAYTQYPNLRHFDGFRDPNWRAPVPPQPLDAQSALNIPSQPADLLHGTSYHNLSYSHSLSIVFAQLRPAPPDGRNDGTRCSIKYQFEVVARYLSVKPTSLPYCRIFHESYEAVASMAPAYGFLSSVLGSLSQRPITLDLT
jgi:hypothetical protein